MKNHILKTVLPAILVLGMTGCGGGDSEDSSYNAPTDGTIDSEYFGIWHGEEESADGSIGITYVYGQGAVSFMGNIHTNSCNQSGELTPSQFYGSLNSGNDEWAKATSYKDTIVSACGTYESIAQLVPGESTSGGSTGGVVVGGGGTGGIVVGGGDPGVGDPGTGVPSSDLTGSEWSVTETGISENCGDGLGSVNYSITVVYYSGGTTTVSTPVGNQNGTYSGNTISYNGSFPEDGGTTTANTQLSINSSYNELTGTSNWTWSDGGGYQCSGTTSVSATRQ